MRQDIDNTLSFGGVPMSMFPSYCLDEKPEDIEWIKPQKVQSSLHEKMLKPGKKFAYRNPRGEWCWVRSEAFVVEDGGRKYIIARPLGEGKAAPIRVRYMQAREFQIYQ